MADPAERARQLAAKFSQKLGGQTYTTPMPVGSFAHQYAGSGSNDTVLGKRMIRDDQEFSGSDIGGSKRKKLIVPVHQFPDVNFVSLVNNAIPQMQNQTRTRIQLLGKGSDPQVPIDPLEEEMHVLVSADSDDAVENACIRVHDLLNNPATQAAMKSQQLTVLNNFVSPLAKEPAGRPGTFSLSSALYANDTGYTMMAPRITPEELQANRRSGLRPGESAKDLWLEQDKIGLIIGRGGETCKAIQASTGVYIQVHRDGEGESRPGMRQVTLKGNDRAIDTGEAEIMRIINERGPAIGGGGGGGGGGGRPGLGFGGGGGGPDGDSEFMQVPTAMIGLVIGRGGEVIKGIQDRTGCSLHVQKDAPPDGPDQRIIKLIGNPQATAAARDEIQGIMMTARESGGPGFSRGPRPSFGGPPGIPGMDGPPGGGYQGGGGGYQGRGGGGGYQGSGGGGYQGGGPAPPQPGQTQISIPVPSVATGTIIGRGGEIVKRLQQISGARINLAPGGQGEFRDVIIIGRPEQIEIAKREIEEIINAKTSGAVDVIDPRQVGAATGRGGGFPPSGYAGGGGGYGGHGGPPQGGYGGPQQGGGYGGQQQGGYGGPPQHQQGGYGAQPSYGAPAASPEPPPNVEVEAPVPPTDPKDFEGWWGTLPLAAQQAYYKKYYPEMLSQLTGGR